MNAQIGRVASHRIGHGGAAEGVHVAVGVDALRIGGRGGVGELVPILRVMPDLGELLEHRVAGSLPRTVLVFG